MRLRELRDPAEWRQVVWAGPAPRCARCGHGWRSHEEDEGDTVAPGTWCGGSWDDKYRPCEVECPLWVWPA